MGLKLYIGFSLLFIVAVGLLGYSIENAEYEVSLWGYTQTLPIVVWVLTPLILLFILTVLHLIFYGSISYCKNIGFRKDEVSIINSIKTLLLQKEDKTKFKTKAYRNIALILRQLNFDVKETAFTSSNEELNKVVSQIKDIKSGKYVSDKALKLNLNSNLLEQNLINKVNEETDYALDVLKKSDQFSLNVLRSAYFSILENKSMTTIKKYYLNIELDKEMALKLFIKDIENNEFGLKHEEILKITKNLKYSKDEYITLAKLYKPGVTPDKLLELFQKISEDNEVALDSYFYILLELEMIDKIKDLLSAYPEDEFLVFRALLDLKDAGKHYSLDDIIYK